MLALLHKKISKMICRHQYWVHPLVCTRLETGQFCTLFYELRKDKSDFFKYFRSSDLELEAEEQPERSIISRDPELEVDEQPERRILSSDL
jgi:hypothetical protein